MPIPKEIYEETLLNFFAPIRPFLDDPKVSEVMINGPNLIFIERIDNMGRDCVVAQERLVTVVKLPERLVGPLPVDSE